MRVACRDETKTRLLKYLCAVTAAFSVLNSLVRNRTEATEAVSRTEATGVVSRTEATGVVGWIEGLDSSRHAARSRADARGSHPIIP